MVTITFFLLLSLFIFTFSRLIRPLLTASCGNFPFFLFLLSLFHICLQQDIKTFVCGILWSLFTVLFVFTFTVSVFNFCRIMRYLLAASCGHFPFFCFYFHSFIYAFSKIMRLLLAASCGHFPLSLFVF